MTHPDTARKTSPRWIDLTEAADILGVTTSTIRAWIGDGTLTGYRVGHRFIRLDAAEVHALPQPIAKR